MILFLVRIIKNNKTASVNNLLLEKKTPNIKIILIKRFDTAGKYPLIWLLIWKGKPLKIDPVIF